jgi:3-dehydroquinate synthase
MTATHVANRTRFILVDFESRGSIALVTRSGDGDVDVAPHAADVASMLDITGVIVGTSGDWLVDAIACRPIADVVRVVHECLKSVSAAVRPFGFDSIVLASRAFADATVAASFERGGDIDTAVSLQIEALDSRASRAAGPGVRMTGPLPNPTLSVKASRDIEYHVIHVGRPVFDVDEPALAELIGSRPAIFFVDEVVKQIYGDGIARYAARHLDCVGLCSVEGNEESKTWAQVEDVCARLVHAALRRDGVVVAVGGGTTLDITGLAASLYRRGVRFVRIPTTLIGMVDVCVGIKQGANFGGKRNVVGSFYPPFGCINDLRFLETLPLRYLSAGVSEIVKMALIRDPVLFELVERHVAPLVASRFQSPRRVAVQVVVRAELAMMRELQPNLFEQDLQRYVDLGHSFSPWLESASRYELNHGEAVGIDMMMCTAIAVRRGICDESVLRRLARIYNAAGLPLVHQLCNAEPLVASLADIRANRGGDLNIVLPTSGGRPAFVQSIDVAELEVALRDIEELAPRRAATVEHAGAVAGS